MDMFSKVDEFSGNGQFWILNSFFQNMDNIPKTDFFQHI